MNPPPWMSSNPFLEPISTFGPSFWLPLVQVTTLQYMEQLKLALASASSLNSSIYPTLPHFFF